MISMSILPRVNITGADFPLTNENDLHLIGLSFSFIDFVQEDISFMSFWWVHRFVVQILKSSANGVVII